jgi:hypothetical protein
VIRIIINKLEEGFSFFKSEILKWPNVELLLNFDIFEDALPF